MRPNASLHVPQRFPEGRPLAADVGRWVVACVKPRHEKALARDLGAVGIAYYLPLIRKVHRRPDNGWLKKADVPLFPGYMAVAGPGCRPLLYAFGRVNKILRVPDQERFTRELEDVEKALRAGSEVELHPSIPLGSLVEITRGPLRGVTGRLERIGKHFHLILCVEFFRQCVRVKLHGDDVKVPGNPCTLFSPSEPRPQYLAVCSETGRHDQRIILGLM